MRHARPWIALAAAAVVASAAAAQGVQFRSPQVYEDTGARYLLRPAEEVVSLEGLDALGRPREREVVVERERAGAAREGGFRGGVGNVGVGGAGSANVGFTYLAPLYSSNDFQRTVPRGYAGLFPTFGGTGQADTLFAFSPRIDLNYYVKDVDLSVSTSGAFVNLTGRVDRQAVRPDGGTAQLNAQSSLTLVTAIPVEFGREYGVEGGFNHFPDSVIDFRLGSRYVSFDQNYTGVTTEGGATANRYASQTYRGLGVSTAAIWHTHASQDFSPFLSARQSLTIGENRQNTSVSVTAPGVAFADNRFDTHTLLMPSTELEVGVDWAWRGATRVRDVSPPVVRVRVAAVGQYWYGMGPLSAGAGSDFRRNDLFLVGGYIQAGVGF